MFNESETGSSDVSSKDENVEEPAPIKGEPKQAHSDGLHIRLLVEAHFSNFGCLKSMAIYQIKSHKFNFLHLNFCYILI